MDGLKKTPLYASHIRLRAKMVEFGGWEMPIQYSNITEEHQAVRNGVGLFDVSHMGEVIIKGEDAEKFINYLITNDVKLLGDNEIQYAMMCYENGGVVDDLLVYRKGVNHYLLIINAGNIEKDLAWIYQVAKETKMNISISDESPITAEVALQGPSAEILLQEHVNIKLSELPFFTFAEKVSLFGAECLISRTGYTGEDGFEIYADIGNIETIWNKLLDYGSQYGILPCGLGSRDTLRFEANLPLYGHEITESISPLEAGYGFCVKLDKDDFKGKAALKSQKENGLKRRIVGFELVDKGIARADYIVTDENDQEIGHVTTGYKSPTLDKSLGLALISSEYAGIGKAIYIQIRNKTLKATIVSRKFLNKNYKKQEDQK
ncbi:MAG: glycine cleavage system aminomethyltransferase GcvT [Eubacteriales bacterium]|nr:glycine cleavage system aminomethyltransferase GcvT [Eubacteriales bacterium]